MTRCIVVAVKCSCASVLWVINNNIPRCLLKDLFSSDGCRCCTYCCVQKYFGKVDWLYPLSLMPRDRSCSKAKWICPLDLLAFPPSFPISSFSQLCSWVALWLFGPPTSQKISNPYSFWALIYKSWIITLNVEQYDVVLWRSPSSFLNQLFSS